MNSRTLPFAALLLGLLLVACGPSPIRYPAPTTAIEAIRHDDYESLLGRYLSASGEVNYSGWQKAPADVAALDRYLGRLTATPPKRRPELFSGDQDKLSYWINLYNALVVREVLRRWPLESVRDYRPTLGSKIDTTKGFFRDLRFVVGGKEMSLDDIEHATIRNRFDDARVHFALNCGSSSCPVLQPKAFSGESLEAELQSATVAFLNAPENVRVDADRQRIYLSKILKWYGGDFKKHARRATGNQNASALDFVALFAKPELSAALLQAREDNFATVYTEYNWSVNDSDGSSPAQASTAAPIRKDFAATTLPPLKIRLASGENFEREQGKALIISFWATYCAPCRKSLPHLQSLESR